MECADCRQAEINQKQDTKIERLEEASERRLERLITVEKYIERREEVNGDLQKKDEELEGKINLTKREQEEKEKSLEARVDKRLKDFETKIDQKLTSFDNKLWGILIVLLGILASQLWVKGL